MLIVAQRVIAGDEIGINAYYHEHGQRDDWSWAPPAGVPDAEPGTLRRRSVRVKGIGRVAAYLDLAAPDGSSLEQLRWGRGALASLLSQGASMPLIVISGPLFVRFEVERARLEQWSRELDELFAACSTLLP